MAAFCEYIGFGGVCMRPQATQTQDTELLQYCEMHLGIVRRERAKRLRVQQLQTAFERLGGASGGRHVSRSRSEPYLQRSTSRGAVDRDSSPRITVIDGSDDSEDEQTGRVLEANDTVAAHRSTSSLLHEQDDSRRATMDAFERITHGTRAKHSEAPPKSENRQTSTAQRKRVRVKKIVIPPRFEVLDSDEGANPPDLWYVRLAERVPGEPGDADEDEYIEVDMPDAAPGNTPI